MKRFIPCLLLAALALSGCSSPSGTRSESAAAGATRAEQQSQTPRTDSPWANDHNFIAPAM
jgi:PBP1b-binding outer membrane lipoprotein LpoB